MSGGVAYVYDINNDFSEKCNMEMIELSFLDSSKEIDDLKKIIVEHYERTGSARADLILKNWEIESKRFVKVMPTDYKKMLGYIEKIRENKQNASESEIVDAAFDMHIANLAKG